MLLVALVPLATIGPNIGQYGLRTEHLYAILAAGILLAVYGPPRRLTVAYLIVAGSWVTVLLVALVGGMMPAESLANHAVRTALEGLARISVPILGLIIGGYASVALPTTDHAERRWAPSPLELMMTVVVAVACVNAVVAFAWAIFDPSWLALFRAGADEGRIALSTSDKASQSGRYGGMVVQPVEAGLLYSIALITAIRKWSTNAVGLGVFVVVSGFISVGGLISGSKVFLFGGLPVALFYLALCVRTSRPSRLIGAGTAALASVVVAWHVLSVLNPMGAERISGNYLLWNEERPWHNLFAARFDSNGLTMDGAQEAFREAGLFGVGAQGTRWPYDIGVLEFVSVAGWLGVALMAVISMVLLVTSSSRRHERYWLVLALLVVGTNIGGPAFTANRNALVIWVLLGAMLQYRPVQAGGRGPRRRPNA